MALNYEYDKERGTLKINCLGTIYGASLEDYEELMAVVIDSILEIKKVSSIVLSKEREYEYGPEQSRMLVEVAEAIEEVVRERLISSPGPPECKKFFPEWTQKLQNIVLDLMRRDPIGAYVEILREIRRAQVSAKTMPSASRCYKHYIEDILNVLKIKLAKTEMIKKAEVISPLAGYHIGDRSIYRQLFSPSVRPNFMLTRFMITPPEKGKSVDKYKIGQTEVEIFKIPGETQYLYHVVPPEFRLSEEHYSVLDAVRRYMAAHRPKSIEFVRSEERGFIYNIGEDMIKNMAMRMKVRLSTSDLNNLSTILTRYTAGLGVLEVLLSDEKLQDIYINSPVERLPILIFHSDYEECRTNLIPTRDDAEGWATRLRSYSGRPLDEANPVLDTELTVPGGRARFAVIGKPLSPEGLGFAVRRHRDKPWTLPLFMKSGMLDATAAGLLSFLFDNSVSMLVAGGRSSGKTSLLASLLLELLPKVRVLVQEDTLELPIKQLRDLNFNIESLKSRSVITKVETEVSADEALRTALRLGDSALIVGEIRSMEAKVLWEAMRIGSLSNVVAGTIHGESAYGVYDRVVNDLGVQPTSFKATDIICIARRLRSADGLHTLRRLVNITEIRKEWDKDPAKEGGFVELMTYSGKEDRLKTTNTLISGESEILNRIASYVRDWSGNWNAVWENISMRAKIKQMMLDASEKLKRPELIEGEWVVKANSAFHLLSESVKKETGHLDTKRVYKDWTEWFKKEARI